MTINKLKKTILLVGTFAIVLLATLSIYKIYKFINPFYKIEDRTKQLEQIKKEKNETITGWLKVQGTNIDYPVVYSKNIDINTLRYDFGWVNSYNTKGLFNNIVIFGHNIKNVSNKPLITDENHERFEHLLSFIYHDYAEDNQYIQYTINDKNYLYKIFSVSLIKESQIDYAGGILDKTEMKEYIKEALNNSYYDYNTSVSEDDCIITLVTCTRFYGNKDYSFRIVGKLVTSPFIEKGKVIEKDNYRDVKKILMSGDQ